MRKPNAENIYLAHRARHFAHMVHFDRLDELDA
jgi:hypothetical protein